MFYNARWYDPTIGRFIQADTIVPGGVQGYDRYTYANNSPVVYNDPSGHIGIALPKPPCEDSTTGCQPGNGNSGGDGGSSSKSQPTLKNGGERTFFTPVISNADLQNYNLSVNVEETYSSAGGAPELDPRLTVDGVYVVTASANGAGIMEDFATTNKGGPALIGIRVSWQQWDSGLVVTGMNISNPSGTTLLVNHVDIHSNGGGGVTMPGSPNPIPPSRQADLALGRYPMGSSGASLNVFISVVGGKPGYIRASISFAGGSTPPPGCALPMLLP